MAGQARYRWSPKHPPPQAGNARHRLHSRPGRRLFSAGRCGHPAGAGRTENLHAPLWIVMCAGLVFFLAGAAIILQVMEARMRRANCPRKRRFGSCGSISDWCRHLCIFCNDRQLDRLRAWRARFLRIDGSYRRQRRRHRSAARLSVSAPSLCGSAPSLLRSRARASSCAEKSPRSSGQEICKKQGRNRARPFTRHSRCCSQPHALPNVYLTGGPALALNQRGDVMTKTLTALAAAGAIAIAAVGANAGARR